MRVHLRIGSPSQTDEARVFNQFLCRIGHGTEPVYLNRGSDVVRITDEFVSKAKNVSEFIDELYPDLATKSWRRSTSKRVPS